MVGVDLDALVPREDFEVSDIDRDSGDRIQTIQIRDLEKNTFFYQDMRKPDFQRETNEWDPNRVCALIESFVQGDLIPAIILWKNKGSFTFVLDGSHRLSALISWVNDDYGDGEISKKFYDRSIPEDQIKLAQKTREKVRKEIGSYKDHIMALEYPEKTSDVIKRNSKIIATRGLQLQWVNGDADKAEASFFKINQSAATINDTEIYLLKKRKKANGVAARAIIRSGTGHKYWSRFPEEEKNEIENLAKEINEILFIPPLKNPIKTLDLPIGGKVFSTSTLTLILNFVNISNAIEKDGDLEDDITGKDTIEFLKKCQDSIRRINSGHPGSLGLHPAVYFYSRDGRYKIASFYGILTFVMGLEINKKFKEFITIREGFEEFILDYDFFIQQIGRRYRSAFGSYRYIKEFYDTVMNKLLEKKSSDEIVKEITNDKKFNYLTTQHEKRETVSKDFTREVKSEAFMVRALKAALKCEICKGYIHQNSIQFDHAQRKSEGGGGGVENVQLSHPYCNTTFKH